MSKIQAFWIYIGGPLSVLILGFLIFSVLQLGSSAPSQSGTAGMGVETPGVVGGPGAGGIPADPMVNGQVCLNPRTRLIKSGAADQFGYCIN